MHKLLFFLFMHHTSIILLSFKSSISTTNREKKSANLNKFPDCFSESQSSYQNRISHRTSSAQSPKAIDVHSPTQQKIHFPPRQSAAPNKQSPECQSMSMTANGGSAWRGVSPIVRRRTKTKQILPTLSYHRNGHQLRTVVVNSR